MDRVRRVNCPGNECNDPTTPPMVGGTGPDILVYAWGIWCMHVVAFVAWVKFGVI